MTLHVHLANWSSEMVEAFRKLPSAPGAFANAVSARVGRYCTIRDNEKAPHTSKPERYWVQIYRTPDNTE